MIVNLINTISKSVTLSIFTNKFGESFLTNVELVSWEQGEEDLPEGAVAYNNSCYSFDANGWCVSIPDDELVDVVDALCRKAESNRDIKDCLSSTGPNTRMLEALGNHGIIDLKELSQYSELDLARMPGIGAKARTYLKELLEEHGY